MHSSQGGTQMEGGLSGSTLLLRGPVSSRAETHKLCLQCHAQSGSQSDVGFQPHGNMAPKVHGSGWDGSKSFGEVGAGGDFSSEIGAGPNFNLTAAGSINALGYGHSVGLTGVNPPGNPNSFTFSLTCTACHDPHGATASFWRATAVPYGINKYRNLYIMPPSVVDFSGGSCAMLCHSGVMPFAGGELNQMKSWVGSISSGSNFVPYVNSNGVRVWPVYNGNPLVPANNNVYDGIFDLTSDINGNFGDGTMGSWCARCHPKMHDDAVVEATGSPNSTGQDWFRHPAEYQLDDNDKSGAAVDTIDWNHYNDDISAGFKVPAANTNPDLTNETYYANEEVQSNGGRGDKVFCLSCHFAHGGPYYDALRWDYTSAVELGSQLGNGVPSDRGCQQCHNR